ncbi:heteromeric transposase endonuclease subunit TnsA [Arcobacter sp. F155]|uniref:TnsA endonuclease N-terminal domain-containing protein n=1 Tax=Arcobacter sp. F155 TaxID=2044512 RepID=UPI00100AC4B9|nr:TnsA endonuclease N-terminal domain-containing protein [Arcobacter sp. F155]RXJ77049.1 heteromeric transposase endonuclease subunit TnsA [Arcobacter sp. F155]
MKIKMNNRKIGYTYGSVSGHYPFRKKSSIAYESLLERDFLIMLEFNDSVSEVVGQPLSLIYKNKNGKTVPYTPDFLVYFNEPNTPLMRLKRKPLLIEVKPKDKLEKNFCEYKYRFKQAIKYAQENDLIFKIYDESKIRTQYFKNIMFLKRYQRLNFDNEDIDEILSFLYVSGNNSIEYVLEYFCVTKEQKGLMLSLIYNLLYHKKILCNFNQPINMETQIWLNELNEEESL